MPIKSAIATISELSRPTLGMFRGRDAVALDITRNRLTALCASGALARELPDVYRMTVVKPSATQHIIAALLWGGDDAVAVGRSAGATYQFEGVRSERPEIAVPTRVALRSKLVTVRRYQDPAPLMIRTHRGVRVTGVEATLVALAHALDGEAFEIACEDARRRRLTTVAALRAYLDRFGRRGMPGLQATRALLNELDPVHPSRSTLEVKTRRLLVAHGITEFVREYPLEANGRTYRFDFAFPKSRTILETNGRRWHDDPADDERDNEKWTLPARHGWRIALATWDKVTRRSDSLLEELTAVRAA
jgi:very-short-patch-repair endonuclease